MNILNMEKLTKLIAGIASTPKFMRKFLFKNDHSLKLRVGSEVVAEFESGEEENEFYSKLMDSPKTISAKGWRQGGG